MREGGTMQWHEPRHISTLDPHGDWPDDVGQSVLVYNPCDGWHLLWTIMWSVQDVLRQGMFDYWMPGPPEPAGFDREAWAEASLARDVGDCPSCHGKGGMSHALQSAAICVDDRVTLIPDGNATVRTPCDHCCGTGRRPIKAKIGAEQLAMFERAAKRARRTMAHCSDAGHLGDGRPAVRWLCKCGWSQWRPVASIAPSAIARGYPCPSCNMKKEAAHDQDAKKA